VTYLFLDVETTGLDVGVHEVWEIAYAIDDGPIRTAFVPHTLDNADPKALEINNYWARFDQAPDLSGLFEQNLRDLAQEQYLVGSNPAFDHRMLLKRWGSTPWHYRMIDLAAYAMPYFGWNVPEGMAQIARSLDITEGDHSAARDVETLRECFYALQQKYNLERAFA